MDKNTLVGFVLIGAVIIGFGIYNTPNQEERARAQHYQDSIQQVIKEKEELMKKQEAAAEQKALIVDSTSVMTLLMLQYQIKVDVSAKLC